MPLGRALRGGRTGPPVLTVLHSCCPADSEPLAVRVGAARFMDLTSSRFPSPLPGGHLLCTGLCVGGTWDRVLSSAIGSSGRSGPISCSWCARPSAQAVSHAPPVCRAKATRLGRRLSGARGHEADRPAGDGQSRQRSSSPSPSPRRTPWDALRVPEQTGPGCGSEGQSKAGTVPEGLLPEQGLGLSAAAAPSLGLCRGPQAIDTMGSLARIKPSPQSPPQEAASVYVSG